MSWPWTLYRYLAVQFLASVGIALGSVVFLSFSMDLVLSLFDRTAGRHVSAGAIVGMSLFQLPDLSLKLLPFAVLIGGAFSFVRLSRSQELLAIRAAGVSAWNILAPPVAAAVVLGVFTVVAFTPVLRRRCCRKYSALEATYIRGQASQLAISRNGLWLRQGGANGQSVIHSQRVADQGVRLEDVIVFFYGDNDKFLGRIDAQSANLQSR